MVQDPPPGDTIAGARPDDATAPVAPVRAGRWTARLARIARGHRLLIVVVAAGFALRLGWVLAIRPEPPTHWLGSGDQFSYYYYGLEISQGRGYVSYINHQPTAYYPVGYPAILAALFWVVRVVPGPDNYLLAALMLNVAVSTATIVGCFLIGRALLGRPGGLVAAGVVAAFPNLVYQTATLQLETMFIASCALALSVVATHDWSVGPPSTRRLVAFGLALGVSVAIRPFSVWFVAAVLAAALVARVPWRRAVRTAVLPLLIVVAMGVPWVIRNAIRLDAFVPTSTNTGDTLCLDRSLDANGGFRWADHEGCADPDLPEVERSRESTAMAIEFVLDHPGRELQQIVRRGRLMMARDDDGILAVNTLGGGPELSASTSDRLASLANGYWFGVLALAALGLGVVAATRRRAPVTALFLVSLAALAGVPLLLWGNPRFHLPFAPLLAILAAAPAAPLVERRRRGAAWRR